MLENINFLPFSTFQCLLSDTITKVIYKHNSQFQLNYPTRMDIQNALYVRLKKFINEFQLIFSISQALLDAIF